MSHPTSKNIIFPDLSKIDLGRVLFGNEASTKEILPVSFTSTNSDELFFLLVVAHSIDWQAAEKSRYTYDFSKTIDFAHFAKSCENQNIDLLQSYAEYMNYI